MGAAFARWALGGKTEANIIGQMEGVLVAEGLDFFRVRVPRSLAGTTIADCGIRERTGCSVVAVKGDGEMQVVPSPTERLPAGGEMLLIGTVQAEESFLELYRDAAEG